MKRLFGLLIVLCALLVCSAVAAYHYLGIAGVAGVMLVVFALLYGAKRFAAYALGKVITGAIRSKGDVLKGAKVEIHSIAPASPPELDDEVDDEERADSGARQWYTIDLTISPQQGEQQCFSYWEPGELIFVSPDAEAEDIESDIDEPLGEIHNYQIWEGATFVEDECGKHQGPQRLRLHAGMIPGTTRAQLRYYFNLFGSIDLPKPPAGQARQYTNGSTPIAPH